MAKDILDEVPSQWRERDVRWVVQDELHRLENERNEADEPDEPDEPEDIMDVLGSLSGYLLAKFPLSMLWILGSILVGIGTGNFLESVGWGFLTLAGGWVLLRIGIFLK